MRVLLLTSERVGHNCSGNHANCVVTPLVHFPHPLYPLLSNSAGPAKIPACIYFTLTREKNAYRQAPIIRFAVHCDVTNFSAGIVCSGKDSTFDIFSEFPPSLRNWRKWYTLVFATYTGPKQATLINKSFYLVTLYCVPLSL